jgi:hypothetical protein
MGDLKLQTEVNTLGKLLDKLEKKYLDFPSKSLYDAIINLKESISSLKLLL